MDKESASNLMLYLHCRFFSTVDTHICSMVPAPCCRCGKTFKLWRCHGTGDGDPGKCGKSDNGEGIYVKVKGFFSFQNLVVKRKSMKTPVYIYIAIGVDLNESKT